MELFLNLVWFGLAIVSLGGCVRISKAVGVSKNTRPTRGSLIVACVLALLFPIVSASDDLCAVRFAAEDTGAEQGKGRHLACHSWPAPNQDSPAFLNAALWNFVTPARVANEQVVHLDVVFIDSLCLPTSACRAPPSVKSSSSAASQLLSRAIGLDLSLQHLTHLKSQNERSAICFSKQTSESAFGGLDAEHDSAWRGPSSTSS